MNRYSIANGAWKIKNPRSKNRPLDCFCPAGRTAGLRLAVTASACAPWAGLVLRDRCACSGSLFPPQAAVASTASHSRPQWCTNGSSLKQKQAIKKYPATSCEVFCGAPCRSKPEHFCVSGRHRHHTAAHPEVMLLFLLARIKEGCWNIKGLLRHILALQTGLRYSTVPLTFPIPLFLANRGTTHISLSRWDNVSWDWVKRKCWDMGSSRICRNPKTSAAVWLLDID